MKKKLLVTAISTALGVGSFGLAASAQADVTVYGAAQVEIAQEEVEVTVW